MNVERRKLQRGLLVAVLFATMMFALGGQASGSTNCDPDFESGPTGECWVQSPAGRTLITSTLPLDGTFSAELCGINDCTDRLAQVIEIPEDAEYASLNFAVRGIRSEPDGQCQDILQIGLLDEILGEVNGTSFCDNSVPQSWQSWQLVWDKVSYPEFFEGSTVTVVLDGATDEGLADTWFIDNAAFEISSTPPAPPSTLAVTKAGAGSGRVTSDPGGIDCGTTCSADFEPNTEVTLTADPNDGSTFSGWSGACTGTGACVVTMDDAKGVTATFASAGGGAGDGSGDSVTDHPRSVTLTLRKHLRASGSVSAGGYGPCQNNSTVKIQRKAGGVFKTIKTVSTGSDNRYATAVPHRMGTYRAQVVANTPRAGHRCLADNSPTRRHAH